jgi:formylglycine-generating enzyme required for sulfatase activity
MFVQRACLMTVALALAFAWGGNDARGEKPNKRPPAPQPAPQPAPPQRAPPPTVVPCPSAPDMLAIPAGTFRMGTNDGDPDEKPVHAVTVAAFCMDPTEVTVAAYKGCTSCSAPSTSGACNWGVAGRDNHPINCVDWNQATAFCTAVGKRLPTEEEWEYAARGAAGWKHPWGNTPPSNQLCWARYGDGKPNSTCPAGSYSAGRSPFGLNDMAGNVCEWTSSPYCPYTDPACSNSARVGRGGCWSDGGATIVRGASRYIIVPGDRGSLLGFRCAR